MSYRVSGLHPFSNHTNCTTSVRRGTSPDLDLSDLNLGCGRGMISTQWMGDTESKEYTLRPYWRDRSIPVTLLIRTNRLLSTVILTSFGDHRPYATRCLVFSTPTSDCVSSQNFPTHLNLKLDLVSLRIRLHPEIFLENSMRLLIP